MHRIDPDHAAGQETVLRDGELNRNRAAPMRSDDRLFNSGREETGGSAERKPGQERRRVAPPRK
jgi:hypothetical protein